MPRAKGGSGGKHLNKTLIKLAYTIAKKWDNWVDPIEPGPGQPPPATHAGFQALRDNFRAQGFPADDAWRKAMEVLPLPPDVFAVAKKMAWQKNKDAAVAKLDAEAQRMLAAPPLLEEADHTGIELVDWLYANMQIRTDDKLTSPPRRNGDMALLRYYRDGRAEEFYQKMFTPALLKRHALKAAEDESAATAEPPKDKAHATADELLRAMQTPPAVGRTTGQPSNYVPPVNGKPAEVEVVDAEDPLDENVPVAWHPDDRAKFEYGQLEK